MCGIVGIISKNVKDYLEPALEKISHRGPDDSGTFIYENLGLGHRRLAIQDLSNNGHQPMISDCENYILIFNGEIYNHLEIRQLLDHKYTFKSESDTETLLYGFKEYGSEILNKLNGIFSFAIFNKKEKKLFIARDNFGVKPLYYYRDESLFWFSSEIKSILPLPFYNTINPKTLVDYLTFLYAPGEKTPFTKVFKLLPGHYIVLNIDDFDAFKIKKYYKIPFDGKRLKKTTKELESELEKLLIKAVDRQMLADVPVGFFLSGGLDSSCIVALAKKLHPNKKFNCYTIKTNNGEDTQEGFANDLFYARKVAKHLDVNLIEVESTIDIVKDFDKMIYHLDEPQADPAPLSVLQICTQARKDGQIVLLGGAAGDDLFSGYRRHQALRIEKYWNIMPVFFRKAIKSMVKLLPANKATFRRARKLVENCDKSKQSRLIGYFSWIDLKTINNLFSKSYSTTLKRYDPLDTLRNKLKEIPKEKDPLNQMLYLEMNYFLADHNLNYTDKMSMATGVEVRVPFLDKELVEFSCKIPTHLKLKGVTTKYLLKKVMEKYLPKDVIYRPKSGFGAPVRQWITKDMDVTIKKYLSQKNLEKVELFSYKAVKKLIKDNKSGKIDASYTIWALLSIESWIRQFNATVPKLYEGITYSKEQKNKL